MEKITDEQRQTLTGWLGECWSVINSDRNRTFDNWNDFGAVVEKLTQSGQRWNNYKRYARKKYNKEFADTWYPSPIFDIWLLENPERFCILVAEAIKEGIIAVDFPG